MFTISTDSTDSALRLHVNCFAKPCFSSLYVNQVKQYNLNLKQNSWETLCNKLLCKIIINVLHNTSLNQLPFIVAQNNSRALYCYYAIVLRH